MCMGWPGLTFKMWSSDSFESSEFLVTFIFPSIFCLKYVDNIYTHGWWWLALCIANPPLSLTCFFIWGNACVLVLMFLATPVTCSKTFYPHSLALLWEDCWLHILTQIIFSLLNSRHEWFELFIITTAVLYCPFIDF